MTDDLLRRAAACAVAAHQDQDRKSSPLPYVSHCFDVLKQLSIWGVQDRHLLAAALLHDTIEDTDITEAVLREAFDEEVVDLVMAVSWPGEMTKAQKFEQLAELPSRVPDPHRLAQVLLLKMADRMCNVEDYYRKGRKDKYASRYALQGFPPFYFWSREPSAAFPGRLTDDLTWSIARYESIVREKYDSFRVYDTMLEEARGLLGFRDAAAGSGSVRGEPDSLGAHRHSGE